MTTAMVDGFELLFTFAADSGLSVSQVRVDGDWLPQWHKLDSACNNEVVWSDELSAAMLDEVGRNHTWADI